MMRNSRHRLISAAILLCLCLCGSLSLGNDTDALVDKALRLSGISGQIEMLGKSILSAVPSDAFPDQKARNEADAFIRKNASKEALTETIRSAVREKFHKDNIEKIIKFYDSPLGRKVGRLQENALDAGLLKSVREGRKAVVSLDEDRLNTIQRIINSQNVAKTNDVLVISLVRGMLEGSAEKPNTSENESEDIRDKLKAVEKTLAAETASNG